MPLHNHPLPGALLALAESGNAQNHTLSSHLSVCHQCDSSFRSILASMKKDMHSRPRAKNLVEPKCPKTPEEIAVFLCKFKRKDLSESLALPIFLHLNNCFHCFEIFITNWTAYSEAIASKTVYTNQGELANGKK